MAVLTKVIAMSLWGVVVSISVTFGVVSYLLRPQPLDKGDGAHEHPVEQIKSKMITVPLSNGGQIDGYMRLQFTFSVDKSEADKLPVKPDIILVDEAYRSTTEFKIADPQRPSRAELDKITEAMKAAINRRMSSSLVKEVWVQDYSYVSSASIRDKNTK